MGKNKFYAYLILETGEKGILTNWDQCKALVAGKKSRYKSFSSKEEGEEWLRGGGEYEPNPKRQEELKKKKEKSKEAMKKLQEGIYFDAGTGRGIGVEVRVTNLKGESYLEEYFPTRVNEYGNINLGKEKTNNYGELVGIYCALEIALKRGELKIFGDSNLVLYYWSQGRCSRDTLPQETLKLIDLVKIKREEFEKKGGKVEYVSGDVNPADLGFHRL